eukprot:scaffold1471_cov413-Prasinococcus_capsulatus_cf.AAC.4
MLSLKRLRLRGTPSPPGRCISLPLSTFGSGGRSGGRYPAAKRSCARAVAHWGCLQRLECHRGVEGAPSPWPNPPPLSAMLACTIGGDGWQQDEGRPAQPIASAGAAPRGAARWTCGGNIYRSSCCLPPPVDHRALASLQPRARRPGARLTPYPERTGARSPLTCKKGPAVGPRSPRIAPAREGATETRHVSPCAHASSHGFLRSEQP